MKDENLALIEFPNQKKIVEIRGLPGQLKVIGAWFLWSTLHRILFDILSAVLVFSLYSGFPPGYKDISKVFQYIVAGVITPTMQMHIRMNNKARRRWIDKYGS
ncbi:MAG: hypothetical protein KME30_29065 [Iphinoe sp. HA4291-MV1]|jgi:hypothetical protein|nr:hypothetical protein [Iphinoe sp. HA4291-MV1]